MRFLMALLLCAVASAELVDRLAITVGNTVITELQIDEDLRVAALLNGQPINRDPESRRTAADRLVEQLLIQHEIEISRYPPPSSTEVNTLFGHIEENVGGANRLQQLLVQYALTESTLRAHLLAQLATLRFIEFRFRPDITISNNEIEAEYTRLSSTLRTGLPPLDAAERSKISEALVEERTDAALNSWLAESRKQINIVYLDKDLQ